MLGDWMHTTLVVAAEKRERNFFMGMAILIAATVVIGFGSFTLRGMVVHPIPLLVHIHGVLFVSWVAIFLAQTALIQRNARAAHRRLGWFSLAIAVAILVVGPLTAMESVSLNRVPPFFPPNIFLALSFLEIAQFGGLVAAAIILRKRTDWHRRLMLGAMLAILGPAWGRVLPMPLLGPFGGFAVMAVTLIYVAIAMGFDGRSRGKIHRAYYWVAAAVVIEGVGTPLLGMTPPILALAKMLAPH